MKDQNTIGENDTAHFSGEKQIPPPPLRSASE